MASEKALSDEILQDARRKAERARARAQREAKKIIAEAATAAEAEAAKILDAARARAQRLAGSVLATVGVEARRDLLDAQERELDKLFAAALRRVADRAAYDVSAVLAGLAVEAIGAMDADSVVIELAEADRAIATPAWRDDVRRRVGRAVSIAIAEQPARIDGGLVARSADGRLLYDNSFAARIGRLRPDLRRELAALVYPEGDP